MKIIFAGTPTNAAHTLDALVEAGVEVVGVLTREDSLVGRKRLLTPTAVAVAAAKHRIETLKVNTITDDVLTWLEGLKPDLGIVVAYGNIFRRPVLDAPVNGWINIHYSLLPKFPGAAPVQHAILSGESGTGVTIFQLDEGIDTGPILSQATLQIGIEQSAGDLLARLTVLGIESLLDTLANFEERFTNRIVQTTPTGEAPASKISRPEAQLDFSKPANVVHNVVRALNPEPVAWFEFEGSAIRVLKTLQMDHIDLKAGCGELVEGELIVGCGSGAVKLEVVQPAGKNQMSGADWLRGQRTESISIL